MKIESKQKNQTLKSKRRKQLATQLTLRFMIFSAAAALITGIVVFVMLGNGQTEFSIDLADMQIKLLAVIAVCVLGVALISMPMAKYSLKFITKPVVELNDAFKQVAQGVLDFPPEKFTKSISENELSELTESFIMMMDNQKQLAEAGELIAQGDLTTEIKSVYKNDRMANAFTHIVEQLNTLYGEMSKTGMEVAFNGNLAFQGDPEVLTGSFQDFIKGFNLVTATLADTIKMAGESILEIGQGRIPVRVEKDYPGDFNLIKESINACIDGLGALVEGNEVLNCIVRNDFSKKMNQDYSGIFGTISMSINRTVDQFNEIITVTDHIAQGQFSDLQRLQAIGRLSDADILIPRQIEMIQTVQNLVEETKRMTACAIAGDLRERGNSNRFKGEYAKVIDGFNQTLEAIIEPIQEASVTLTALSQGDLGVEMSGEYLGDHSAIKEALNTTARFLKQTIAEITQTLEGIQQGDLNFKSNSYYIGDFAAIQMALNQIATQLGGTMKEISQGAVQVESGARQIASGAQALSQGSTEQASAIEELSASIEEVSRETRKNASSANRACEVTVTVQENVRLGNTQMERMMFAMDAINTSSNDISKIIKVIDEIAFQTNILALNAAVEAARAGDHGKGFAVVAEEVRTLAARSAEAAKETASLIEGSIKNVKDGTAIAADTANSLTAILEKTKEVTEIVGEIASGANEQATAIAEITQGIEQVSQVVINNSATAEESAAASEELSSQAEMLKQMIGIFKLM